MRGVILGVLLAAQLALATSGLASPSDACQRAAALAERRWALPANLLLAIGQVESGRRDAATGQVQPWPWSANAAGSDYVFSSLPEARAVVGFLRERGIASVDVGCFQVNLHHHPTAFASVAEGFDPYANADYAARFLRRLFERSGSWEAAIGAYHSADPSLGGSYRAKVLRAWRTLRAGFLPASAAAGASGRSVRHPARRLGHAHPGLHPANLASRAAGRARPGGGEDTRRQDDLFLFLEIPLDPS